MRVEEKAQRGQKGVGRSGTDRAMSVLAVVVSLLSLGAVGLGARVFAEYQWNSFVGYDSPYLFPVPPGPETQPLTDEVVIIVVDGLRADVARTLPTFQQVAEDGSFLTGRTSQPSLSLPGWTLLTTGAPPEISGVTTNWYEGPVRVDSLFTSGERAGITTSIAGHSAWEQLYGDVITEGWFGARDDAASDEEVGRQAIRILRRLHPELLLVHLPDVDNTGHTLGVGPEYLQAAERADAIIARILEEAGTDATVILTSDHGHIDAGGHGGAEDVVTTTPLVVAGPGTVIGATGEVSQADVAPTVAALLGLSRPTHAVGTVLEGLLDTSQQQRDDIREAHAQVEEMFFGRAGAVLGGEAHDTASLERLQEAKARRSALIRFPLIVLMLAAAAIIVVFATRRLHGGALLTGVLIFVGVWVGLFFARGLTLSFSEFNTEAQIARFLLARTVDSVIAAAAAGLVTGLIAGRRGAQGWFRHGVGLAAWILLTLGAIVGAFVVVYGWDFEFGLPNLTAAFAEYLALLAMLGVGAGAMLIALSSTAGAWVARPRE
ncbi:MAG: alkaline phosphatase family protein [Actinomycetota bacterium]